MLTQIAVGGVLVFVTAIVQAAFMLSGFRRLHALRTHERSFSRHHATLVIVLFVLYMFLAMIVEAAIWAATYRWLGAVTDTEAAIYVSLGSFTTIGFTDVQVTQQWRLLVAIEGVNGMIIFGWATALIIAAIQHFDVWPHARTAPSKALSGAKSTE
jgi:hypothetical protein